ncbi:MAG: RNA-binding cell elongation regulator Jag/EloR [Desulfonauticus sp.]|nr:RNA-binding cell elongation regulator Jag/EloR [Desulfonauticus sp.]
MEEFVEFTGRDVDEAISKACDYFQTARENLEIEIISGGSSGIFGLVGLKKAKIKAKKRTNPIELSSKIKEVVFNLIKPIAPLAEIEVDVEADPIYVNIEEEKNIGILIGKEGQTIAAIQYLANRIIAKQYPDISRVQLDAANYKQKQNEKIKKTALYLAQKAKQMGKAMKTQPLTSYHRRLIHLALQKDRAIQTKSLGEGPLKRVLIVPKKLSNKNNNLSQTN